MDRTNPRKDPGIARPSPPLLNVIREVRVSVGDGLNDDELTRLLRDMALPTEAGFAFLSYSNGFLTLSVPRQDLADWYPEHGWIAPEKEWMARAIAKKYGLSLHEPPDVNSDYSPARADSPSLRHHLELGRRNGTMIVAHPQYLKIRLAGIAQAQGASRSQVFGQELLEDLSVLYQAHWPPADSALFFSTTVRRFKPNQ